MSGDTAAVTLPAWSAEKEQPVNELMAEYAHDFSEPARIPYVTWLENEVRHLRLKIKAAKNELE